MTNPTPLQIKAARKAVGLTQTEAGKVVLAPLRTWQNWEYGKREMPALAWVTFQNYADKNKL
jgi:putative transcriptional regulator